MNILSSRKNLYVVYLLPILLFVVVVVLVLRLQLPDKNERKHVVNDGDYYVGVQLIELAPQRADGSAWDSFDGSAPDVYFSIFWQGQQIYESSVKYDSLLSFWSETQLDIRRTAIVGGIASLDDVIAGGRIRVAKGVPLKVSIYERDIIGDTHIGTFELQSIELFEGLTTYRDPLPEVKRVVIRALSLGSLPRLFSEGAR